MKCPKCQSEDIDWYILTAVFHKPETKIGKCRSCGYELTKLDKFEAMKNDG